MELVKGLSAGRRRTLRPKMSGYTRQLKKIMERCFNIVDHQYTTAHTNPNFPIQIQVHDYVQKNCRDWRMYD
jgi:hypothetical protein